MDEEEKLMVKPKVNRHRNIYQLSFDILF